MKLRSRTLALIAVAVACFGHPPPADAQDRASEFSVTPVLAYRMGGSFDQRDGDGRIDIRDSRAEGVVLNMSANPNGQYELLYSRQRTDATTAGFFANDPTISLDQEQIQLGGTYLFDGGQTRPFVALTLGATRFDPALPDAGGESYFSASFGAGVLLFARERVGLRLEARAFTTFVDDDSALFCSSIGGTGSCLVELEARTVTQWEARAGLVLRF